jgi:hypothetical protein
MELTEKQKDLKVFETTSLFYFYSGLYLSLGLSTFISLAYIIAVLALFIVPVPVQLTGDNFNINEIWGIKEISISIIAIVLSVIALWATTLFSKVDKRRLGINIWKFLLCISWVTVIWNIIYTVAVMKNSSLFAFSLISVIFPAILTFRLKWLMNLSK